MIPGRKATVLLYSVVMDAEGIRAAGFCECFGYF
jgi:hypothetical protein